MKRLKRYWLDIVAVTVAVVVFLVPFAFMFLTAVKDADDASDFGFGSKIGIGGSLAAPPLPHHRAYGSVHGGSRSYANALRSRTGNRAI